MLLTTRYRSNRIGAYAAGVSSEQRVADSKDRPAGLQEEWFPLMRELDLPLMPGFMTAGYTALGHYIYLAEATGGEGKAKLAPGADPATVADTAPVGDDRRIPHCRFARPTLQLA